MSRPDLPVIDVSALVAGAPPGAAAGEIGRACREHGFFYAVGHGVDARLTDELSALSRRFFALPLEDRLALRMELGGRAWRGYFPVGAELTSGRPDQKEGLYFGTELPADDPRVAAGLPLHGPNLFPALEGFRETVLAYLDALTGLGQAVMRGIAASLELPPSYFLERYTRDPLILFRIFNYPPLRDDSGSGAPWSVAEHTDYGMLTLLLQDDRGGLEVRAGERWIDAPPVPDSFVCNLGDMLDRLTGGFYRSTPHRVRNTSGRSRLSFPFFFDPAFDAVIEPLPRRSGPGEEPARWDGASLRAFEGTYGDYLLEKVRRVFPDLGRGLE